MSKTKEPRKPLFKLSATSLTPSVTPITANKLTPQVLYTPKAWQKIWLLVDTCPKEVGWLGTVSKHDQVYLIEDIYVLEQTVTSAETDIEADALAHLALELETAGIDSSTLRYWGHSHVNMQVSPSGQDESQMEEYLEHVDWFIRGIYNKRRDTKVDVFDMTEKLVFQKVNDTVQIPSMSSTEIKSFQDEIKAKVKERTYVYNNYGRNNYSHNQAAKSQNTSLSKTQPSNIYDDWDEEGYFKQYDFTYDGSLEGKKWL